MKKILLVAASALFLLTSSYSQNNDKVKSKIEGSGKVVTKEVTVNSFDELNVNGVFNVLLTQGNSESVKIEADDNLQELFEVKNDGSKLNIGMKKDVNYNSKTKIKVYITFRKLKNMDLKTAGNVSSDNDLKFDDLTINNKSVGAVDLKLTAQKLDINNKSVGNLKLNGKADNVVIKNKGVGSVQASDFVVQKMNIENEGVGGAEVNAEKELVVKDSFLGKVNNKGKASARRLNKVVI